MAERLTGKSYRGFYLKDDFGGRIYCDDNKETINAYYGQPLITKLGKLEDILEKYGIESVEELSDALEFAKVIEQTLSGYGINDNEELECVLEKSPKFVVNDNAEKCGQEINGVFFSNEQILILSQYNELQEPYKKRYKQVKVDRDTWKRACELACDVLRDINYKIYNEDRIDFENIFYQQAKKENDEQSN